MMLSSSLISWKSKKQQTVSKSSSKPEYRDMTSVASDVTWLIRLLQENVHIIKPVALFCDNYSAIFITKTPIFHKSS